MLVCQANLKQLWSLISDPKEAPDNVVMTGEELQATDSVTKESDNDIPNQAELVTAKQ